MFPEVPTRWRGKLARFERERPREDGEELAVAWDADTGWNHMHVYPSYCRAAAVYLAFQTNALTGHLSFIRPPSHPPNRTVSAARTQHILFAGLLN